MKPTKQSANGTSFHDVVITTTVNTLRQVCGEPTYENNSGDDKVNFEWVMETDEGDVFTIYDWKEYRSLDEDRKVEFHIGAHSKMKSIQGKHELIAAIEELN